MSMVKKVARAMADAFTNGNMQFDEASEHHQRLYIEAARAAIEAMMDPTDAMLSDEICAHLESDMDHMTPMGSLNRAYGSMIEAALKEQL